MQETITRAFNVVLITTTMVAVSALLPPANASIIPVLTSGPTDNGSGNFSYSYTADLQEDQRLDPAATNGVTCLGLSGKVSCNPPGTFFTIYDIQGYVSSSATAGNWGIFTQLTGLTPSTTLPLDDTALTNVTFFYTGPVVRANGVVVPFAGFEIVSSLQGTILGVYTSQDTKDVGTASGSTDQTIGNILVPNNGSGTLGGSTPEPDTASMFLIGAAVVIGCLIWKQGNSLAAAKRDRG